MTEKNAKKKAKNIPASPQTATFFVPHGVTEETLYFPEFRRTRHPGCHDAASDSPSCSLSPRLEPRRRWRSGRLARGLVAGLSRLYWLDGGLFEILKCV